jgi:hypothetical protein
MRSRSVAGSSGMRSVSTVVVSVAARTATVAEPRRRGAVNAAASSAVLVSLPAMSTSNASTVVACGT